MTYQEVEARHAQENKLIELARLIGEVCQDIAPGCHSVNVAISKDGQISVYTGDNRIDVTAFVDGQVYYTEDWDRMLGRSRKENEDESVRTDHGV